jgi:hypothetical protein
MAKSDIEILQNENNVKFNDLLKICKKYFGKPRIKGSHHYFETPWLGDPIVNIQRDKRNKKMAKGYQVRDVLKAIKKMEEQ